MKEDIQLKVSESLTKDIGRGIARIDPGDMQAIGVIVGDVILISGQKQAAARIMPAYEDRRGKRLIQIDGILRENSGTALGDKVRVSRVEAPIAQEVVLHPQGDRLAVTSEQILHDIQGLAFKKGNIIRISLLGLKAQEYEIINTVPDGVVLPGKNTKVIIQNNGDVSSGAGMSVRYEDIGSLHKELQRIREMVELPLKFPTLFDRLGIDPPRGVLLSGPPDLVSCKLERVNLGLGFKEKPVLELQYLGSNNAEIACFSGTKDVLSFWMTILQGLEGADLEVCRGSTNCPNGSF